MEKKSELLKRIEELEKLVEQQKTFIEQLLLDKQQPFTYPVQQEGDCPMGGWHEYPPVWHGTTPPPCNKCGKAAPNFGPVWSISTTFDNTDDIKGVT